MKLGLIVEGHGEVAAAPVLVRRIAAEQLGRHDVEIPKPLRVKRNRIGDPGSGELERSLKLLRAGGCLHVLVLFDSDDDCPASLAPALLSVAAAAAADMSVSIVMAHREYEAWFLAAIDSLRGIRAVLPDATYVGDPEAPRGAKGAFEALFSQGSYYAETVDQPAFSSKVDLTQARERSPSFDKLCRELERLLAA